MALRLLGAQAAALRHALAAVDTLALAKAAGAGARGVSSSRAPAQEAPLGAATQRESMHFDLLVVGAGPAGLAAALRFKQLAAAAGRPDLSACVVEKGAEVGAHTLSGCVLEPRALDELLPEWRDDADCPVAAQPVTADRFYFLSARRAWRLPTPPQMRNRGRGGKQNYVVSLSEVVRWLGRAAEAAGVEVFPGVAGARLMLRPDGGVRGVETGDLGVGRDGGRKPSFAAGMALTAGATLLAEGCRGSLSAEAERRFGLRGGAEPQTYALGIKEVWEVDPARHRPGLVWHTVGWPLPAAVYGGGWVYHAAGGRVSLGLVTGLDYEDPRLNLYQEFQRFKRHPAVAALLAGGACLQYGARTLVEGGLQSVPERLAFPGGALVGDAAGFLVVPKIKGTHTAIKSGMLAAEAAFEAVRGRPDAGLPAEPLGAEAAAPAADLSAYDAALRASWVWDELVAARNVRPGFRLGRGLAGGLVLAAADTLLFRGGAPWTLRHRRADHEATAPAAGRFAAPLPAGRYARPDGALTFDLPTSLARSGTNHEHDQPPHLRLRNPKLPAAVNLPIYGGPEARYCPAGVYEYVDAGGEGGAAGEAAGGAEGAPKKRLQINAQNCLHCKACDVKDPTQNIQWVPPEGGGGPAYTLM